MLVPRPASEATMRNAEVAVKNAPAVGLLNCRVITMVTAVVASAEIPAAARFSVLPLPTSDSLYCPPPRPFPVLLFPRATGAGRPLRLPTAPGKACDPDLAKSVPCLTRTGLAPSRNYRVSPWPPQARCCFVARAVRRPPGRGCISAGERPHPGGLVVVAVARSCGECLCPWLAPGDVSPGSSLVGL